MDLRGIPALMLLMVSCGGCEEHCTEPFSHCDGNVLVSCGPGAEDEPYEVIRRECAGETPFCRESVRPETNQEFAVCSASLEDLGCREHRDSWSCENGSYATCFGDLPVTAEKCQEPKVCTPGGCRVEPPRRESAEVIPCAEVCAPVGCSEWYPEDSALSHPGVVTRASGDQRNVVDCDTLRRSLRPIPQSW